MQWRSSFHWKYVFFFLYVLFGCQFKKIFLVLYSKQPSSTFSKIVTIPPSNMSLNKMLKVKYHFLISNSLEIYVFQGNLSSNEKETVNLKKAFGLWRDSQTGRFQKSHLYSHVLDKDLVSVSKKLFGRGRQQCCRAICNINQPNKDVSENQ